MCFISIDFEFSRVTEEKVRLFCCSIKEEWEGGRVLEFWLLGDKKEQKILREYLLENQENVFIGYQTVAESRSFISLDLDPSDFKWIDNFLEYRCLSNHNDNIMFGKHLVDGVVKNTRRLPPKYQRSEDDEKTGFKPKHSLVEATFKFLGIIRDSEHKTKMRDLIISDPDKVNAEDRKAIQEYCTEDVKNLFPMLKEMFKEYRRLLGNKFDKEQLLKECLLRGEYSAFTGMMESWGYPIDLVKTKAFSKSIPLIIYETQKEINSLFPEIKPFRWDKKANRFTWNQLITKEWIRKNCNVAYWPTTEGGDLSLSLEAWTKTFDFKHSYPKDNFGAQIVRYLKLKQSLGGFKETREKDKKIFWDYVGKDGRVRPYMNHYGAQSSRSQPSSTSFLFLKPAWVRSLCEPPKGKAIAGIDYSSQETLLAALWANDRKMIDAYKSGDVYLAYAKQTRAVPQDATKKTHKKERDYFKPIVLSMQYLMTKTGLAVKLTQDTGRNWTEQEAQEEIDKYNNTYYKLHEKQQEIINNFRRGFVEPIKLPCGWYHWRDNDNFRSICNVGIQGMAASIMRKAVQLAIKKHKLKVIKTLHDALYIEYDVGDFSAIDKLKSAMFEAFVFYYNGKAKEDAALIRMDAFTWSPEYVEQTIKTPGGINVDLAPIYIDERAEDEYYQFSKYFEPDESIEAL